MAQLYSYVTIAVVALAAQSIAAQDVMGKLHATEALLRSVKKDAIHSHLERMLQMQADEREPKAPGRHPTDDFGIPLPAAPKSPTKHVSAPRDPARFPMTEHEVARLAAQQAANAAARDAALARKRQIVQEKHAAAAASKKAKRAATAAQQRRRIASAISTSANLKTRSAQQSAAAPIVTSTTAAPAATSSWGVLGYLSAASLIFGLAAALLAAAATIESALLARNGSHKSGGGGAGDWLALTRGLWRRCRRAFSAARKQLTGHGSDLPLSAHEGAGPLARAFAAAAAFVHVFWTHLVDSRGQHLAGAVTAAIDASRRASQGGYASAAIVPDRESGGGAYAASSASPSPSYYAPNVSPFAAPQYQQRRRT